MKTLNLTLTETVLIEIALAERMTTLRREIAVAKRDGKTSEAHETAGLAEITAALLEKIKAQRAG